MKKLHTFVCAGALAVASVLNPISMHGQEAKPKIDLNLNEGLEKKINEPRFNEFILGNLNFQISATPRVFTEILLYGKTKLFTELYYNSEEGVGTNARLEFKNFEFSMGGNISLSGYLLDKYNFSTGLAVIFDRFKLGAGYKLYGDNSRTNNHSISLNGTISF